MPPPPNSMTENKKKEKKGKKKGVKKVQKEKEGSPAPGKLKVFFFLSHLSVDLCLCVAEANSGGEIISKGTAGFWNKVCILRWCVGGKLGVPLVLSKLVCQVVT